MNKEDWQWCNNCYGQTIHINGVCTQCNNHKSFYYINPPYQEVATATDKNGQATWVSEFKLCLN